jgi:hypothetical protein
MIEMWDKLFIELNNQIANELNRHDGNNAFEFMHLELDKVWEGVKSNKTRRLVRTCSLS